MNKRFRRPHIVAAISVVTLNASAAACEGRNPSLTDSATEMEQKARRNTAGDSTMSERGVWGMGSGHLTSASDTIWMEDVEAEPTAR